MFRKFFIILFFLVFTWNISLLESKNFPTQFKQILTSNDFNSESFYPIYLAFDKSDNLYVLSDNNSISVITPDGAIGILKSSTLNDFKNLANENAFGKNAFDENEITDFLSNLNNLNALAFNSSGVLYVADFNSNAVIKFDIDGSEEMLISSDIQGPKGLAFDHSDNLYIANFQNGTISKVTANGTFSLFASGLINPAGLAFDSSENLYVADFGDGAIKKVNPTGSVCYFGSGFEAGVSYIDDDVLNKITDIKKFSQNNSMDAKSNSFIGGAIIRKAPGSATHFSVTAPASVQAGVSFNFTVTALDQFNNIATNYTGTVQFTSSDGSGTLPLNYTFLPSDNGVHTFSATLRTPGNQTLNAIDQVNSITGSTVIDVLIPSTTVLSSSSNPSLFGNSVTFTAQVSATPPGTGTPTGNVQFFIDGFPSGTFILFNGTAFFTTSQLSLGNHIITADYLGDLTFMPSFDSLTQQVIQAVLPPIDLQICQAENRFPSQTDRINIITWNPPSTRNTPTHYIIYRDLELTDRIATIEVDPLSSCHTFVYEDHDRCKHVTYCYYIVSVDNMGNISDPAAVCN